LTSAERTPGTLASAFSTRATHDAHVMPSICSDTEPACGSVAGGSSTTASGVMGAFVGAAAMLILNLAMMAKSRS